MDVIPVFFLWTETGICQWGWILFFTKDYQQGLFYRARTCVRYSKYKISIYNGIKSIKRTH